ncbi:hypothetical protein RHMOL_Rhmol02G0072400 [Rhododendron molle]|uniref:Uncharacterized protein n=1 Tax=Rhododendron molle TaxID=49168 RepID=A0ACC0PNW5_RHOML|nr:hypothetical protein RHMOL_Rhmol02G0072400 [Rhododendron molle]
MHGFLKLRIVEKSESSPEARFPKTRREGLVGFGDESGAVENLQSFENVLFAVGWVDEIALGQIVPHESRVQKEEPDWDFDDELVSGFGGGEVEMEMEMGPLRTREDEEWGEPPAEFIGLKCGVNPGNAPLVVGQLLDDKCPEDFITGLILSVRSLITIETLVEEFEKRNRLRLLTQFLEQLVSEGSQDVHVHSALGKIVIDSNNNPEHFLTTNPYYDPRAVGKYCDERDPTLAVVAYRRGQCDNELINVTNKNALFKLQARYVLERRDGDLWAMVLKPENEFRKQLIDQVVSTEGKSLAQVSAAARAFMAADLRHESIKLLKKFVVQNSAFNGIFNLKNLGILMAIKALEAQKYAEAFDIFKKLT